MLQILSQSKPANFLRFLRDCVRLAFGLAYYRVRKVTPPKSYQSLIRCFCYTRGRSNDFLATAIAASRPYQESNLTFNPSLFPISLQAQDRILENLKNKGFHVLEEKLPQSYCLAIEEFARATPAYARGSKDQNPVVYPSLNPKFTRYEFRPDQILGSELFNKFLLEPLFLQVAGKYLKTAPILDVIGLWWHTAYSKDPDDDAAQFYHFDMDRIKWLKIFVYLTDVTPESGPHCFVSGSHRTNDIPHELIRRGYIRLTDSDVSNAYGGDRFNRIAQEFVAPRGTVIIEDTRGLHKGKHLIAGERLILQTQLSNSLFGGYYPKIRIPQTNKLLKNELSLAGIRSFYN